MGRVSQAILPHPERKMLLSLSDKCPDRQCVDLCQLTEKSLNNNVF